MFFNGISRFKLSGDIDYLKNPYRFENLALGLQMKVNAECYYPGFTRRNYVNAYEYNLSLGKQCMLIEVGAQTNTYQEAKNAGSDQEQKKYPKIQRHAGFQTAAHI